MTASIALRRSSFWATTAFQIVIACIIVFIALTTLAMFIYPGGTAADKTTTGYQFFTNFFSDLGRTLARNGTPNPVASLLFTLAMISAGGGLALFFVAFARFFAKPLWIRVMSLLGTLFGVIAGLCFIGVGFAPSNVSGAAHGGFVLSAFSAFLVAAMLYSVVILCHPGYPNRYAWPFIVFTLLLAAYLVLLTRGPRGDGAVLIQATGQKIIVYASLASILLQSVAAQRVAGSRV